MMRRSAASLVVLVLALGAASCGAGEVLVPTPASVLLEDTRWVVTGFSIGGVGGVLPAGAGLTLDFDDSGGVRGSAGCNSYFGQVSFPAGGIAVTGLGSTEMACEPGVMERESRFLAALGLVSVFSLDGERLTLATADGITSIDLAAFTPEPDRPLAGTTWVLSTLIDGDTASSVVAGTAPQLVIDDAAGTISGDTGCNGFAGTLSVEGPALSVGGLTATEIACEPVVMAQESFVFDVLRAAAAWEIDGPVLRLSAPDGRALEYRAV